jgi:hypothetical protein
MRTAAKVDANQAEIVYDLRKVGATVQLLQAVGGGCPDLLVGYHGANYLLEVKMMNCSLNDLQKIWHRAWNGKVATVHSVMDALQVIGAAR